MIHGYNANFHTLRALMTELLPDFRLIALEVPGLSYRSKLNRPDRFSQRFLINFFQEFVDTLRLEKFHILGTSAGATFAASYALENPGRVMSLAMLGMPTFFKNPADQPSGPYQTPEFYVPQDLNGVQELIEFMYYEAPVIPRHLQEMFLQQNVEQREFRLKVLDETFKRTTLLVPRLKMLEVPSILIHGEHDNVTPQDTIDHLLAVVPSIQSYKVLKAGHTIYIENPMEVASAYRSFIRYSKKANPFSSPDTVTPE